MTAHQVTPRESYTQRNNNIPAIIKEQLKITNKGNVKISQKFR